MPANLPVFDGFASLQGGMNGGVLNTLIADNQFARGVNVTCRGGVLGTRPPVIEVELSGATAAIMQTIQRGKFQGMTFYQHEDTSYIAFAFNGEVFLIDPVANSIYDMTNLVGPMNDSVDRLHFCQAERYLVIQDGTSTPLIIEDVASRLAVQAGPDLEVPTGTLMAYVQGRLFVMTGDNSFVASNIHLPNTPGNVLRFVEAEYLSSGGAFFMPNDFGRITAMSWANAYGEATGDGPLMALCERGIATFKVSVPRLTWVDMPIMKVEPAGNGNASEYCVVRMNEDLLFMSWNGLQDFALLNTEVATRHRLTNLNNEVKPFLDLESPQARRLVMGCKFDDRMLYTVLGEEIDAIDSNGSTITDYRFTGLIALDYAPNNGISSLGAVAKPAYDGVWTGMHPMGLASGIFAYEEMCFIFGKDDSGVNHLYRLMKTQGHDVSVANGEVPIQCSVYTRGMPFVAYDKDYPRPVPQFEKILGDANLWICAFEDDVDVTLSSCPDFSVQFNPISTLKVRAPMALSSHPFTAGHPQSRPKERFPAFSQQYCQPISRRNAVRGFEFQFKLDWAGIANITRFMIAAEAQKEVVFMECATNTQVLTENPPNDFAYDIEDQI